MGLGLWAGFEMGSRDDHKDEGKRDARESVAVALRYEMEGADAPKVVAGGRGSVAEQILQIAFANDVKVRKDADLAELLSAIDIDTEIPVEAFAAVAEILVYVYRANGTPLPSFEDITAGASSEVNGTPS